VSDDAEETGGKETERRSELQRKREGKIARLKNP
jgi:hypothetical protein